MAIAKKYRRKIVVDGLLYFWVVKDNLDSVNLIVELAESQGAKLRISFDYIKMYCGAEKQSIRPSFVRKAILDARAGGWRPEYPGPEFCGATGNFRVGFETVNGIKVPLWNSVAQAADLARGRG